MRRLIEGGAYSGAALIRVNKVFIVLHHNKVILCTFIGILRSWGKPRETRGHFWKKKLVPQGRNSWLVFETNAPDPRMQLHDSFDIGPH